MTVVEAMGVRGPFSFTLEVKIVPLLAEGKLNRNQYAFKDNDFALFSLLVDL
jgi:hypothetical protein